MDTRCEKEQRPSGGCTNLAFPRVSCHLGPAMRETKEGGSRGEESGHQQPEEKANNSGEKEKKPEVAAERRQGEEGEVGMVDAVLA